MYEVKLNNEKIHELSIISNKRLSAGVLAEEVNQIPAFSFTIPCMNPAFSQELHDRKDNITLINNLTGENEFEGHLLTHSQSMDTNGKLCIKAVAEGHMGYLCDSVQMYHKYVDTSPESFLSALLANHNAQVTAAGHPEKTIQLGTISITRSDYRRSKTTAYRNTLEEIRVNLIERIGGEIRVRRANGNLVLDYVDQLGINSSTKIELAKNMKSLSVDIDTTNIVTRLIPLGAQLAPGDSAERLTIESVNSGLPYIDDTTAIAKYGIIVGKVEFDDITVASNLKAAGAEYLQNNNRIRKSYEAQVLDLSILEDIETSETISELQKHSIALLLTRTINELQGEKHGYQPICCGNSYTFVNAFLGLNERLRLFGRTVDIYKPYAPTVRIGDKAERITDIETRTTKLIEYELPQRDNELLTSAKGIATDIINAGINGHIVCNKNELLIMDTDDKASATLVWRYNLNGWAVSHNGYNGPYTMAATLDGGIVADFITAGVLRGLEILNGNGTFHVHPNGTVDASAINITGGSINITTNSQSYDVIQLQCDSWKHQLAPLEWVLENTNTLCKIIAQAGAIFFYYNSGQTMTLDTEHGYITCEGINTGGIVCEDVNCEDIYAADTYAEELYYKIGNNSYLSVHDQIDALWDAVHALQGGS
ncbi:MAG: phage tail protein [Ruminococcus sp.]|nr:phage tail protein [Ruminococcus sp.]